MLKIGLLTIGQSPRDDIVAVMRGYLSPEVEILQRGALDGLDLPAASRLRPEAGQPTLVTRMRDGTEVEVTHEKIGPRLQKGADALAQEGVGLVVLLCTGEFPPLRADRMVLYPGRLLHGLVAALATGARLGVVMPSPAQIPFAHERWAGFDAVVTAASPYLATEVSASEWQRAAEKLRAAGVDLVYLACMGMDEEMKGVVQRVTGKPVVLASAVVARIVDELMGCCTSKLEEDGCQ